MEINKEKNDHSDRTELKRLSALLDKYVKGDCTEEEQRAIEAWYETLSGERETSASEESSAKARIWAEIRSASESLHLKPVKVLVSSQRQWLQWVASIVLVCVSLFLLIRYAQKKELPSSRSAMSTDNWTVHGNFNAHDMRLVLPDSSRIVLKPNAILSYPRSFDGSERLVTLEGEAFFEIEEDRQRPFKVITGEITTRVL
ncbi:MAG TPA: FecR domain-containing protein, partial [Chryseosolibacter sp.]|nr:FecR domain-containing protein [Chryseosolibacter sp.]